MPEMKSGYAAPPAGWAHRLGLRRPRDWVMLIALIVAGGYLCHALLFQGWTYVVLKTSAKAAPAQLRNASWGEPALACPGDPKLGAQFDRLFERRYEAFVTRMLWTRCRPVTSC